MSLTNFAPSPALLPFIEYYSFFEFSGVDPAAHQFKDFPRTAMDMLFFFAGSLGILPDHKEGFQLKDCSFVSLFDHAYLVEAAEDTSLLHVRFRANGIYPFSKVPLREVLNGHLALSDLMGKSTKTILEQMASRESYQERIELFETWLLPFYQRDRLHFRMEQGLQLIEANKGLIKVKALSEKLNTNYKSLDRWFLNMVGLPPKKYLQLARFKHILADLDANKQMDWQEVVVEYGFHDQAHFIKSFKQFAGVSPGRYTLSE